MAEHLTRCEELKQASLTSTNNAPSAADASSSTGQSLPTDVSLFADVSFDLFVDSSSPPTDMSRIYFADLWCPTNVLDASIPADTSFSTDAPLSIDASSPVDTSSPAGTSCIVPNDPPMSIAPATTATTAPPIIPPGAKYNSLSEMLSLAQLKVVPVEGDGNCGFYSFLTSKGNKIEHSKQAQLGTPTVADYQAQQQLRAKCVEWLQNAGSGVTAYHFGTENVPTSSWSPTNIERLRRGKERAGDAMGVYANEPALRAMAATSWQNLVVINSRLGPNLSKDEHAFKGQPPDRVAVYLPGHQRVAALAKMKSWACDIVPALLDPKRMAQYTVIVHNGDRPGSISAHFDATRKI